MSRGQTFQNTINLGNIEGVIQEIGGRRKFRIPYVKGEIPTFQRKVLEEGLCKQLLEMHFLREEGLEWVFYDFNGFLQFNSIFSQWIEQRKNIALETSRILFAVAQCVMNAENYLLSPEAFSLHVDTVFINPITGETRLAYIPGIPHCATTSGCMIELLSVTEQLSTDDEWEAYGKEIRNEILMNNLGLLEIVKCFSDKSREMYSRQWPDKSLVRQELPMEESDVKCRDTTTASLIFRRKTKQ